MSKELIPTSIQGLLKSGNVQVGHSKVFYNNCIFVMEYNPFGCDGCHLRTKTCLSSTCTKIVENTGLTDWNFKSFNHKE